MKRLAFVLLLLPYPVVAETWACSLTIFCKTPGTCDTSPGPTAARLDIPIDGSTGELVLFDGASEAGRLSLRFIEMDTSARSFVVPIVGGSVGFVTLFTDDTVTLTTHEVDAGRNWATAVRGTCERQDD